MVHFFVLLLVRGLLGLSFSLLLLLPFFNICIEGQPEVFAVLSPNDQGIVAHKAVLLTHASSTLVISEYEEFLTS